MPRQYRIYYKRAGSTKFATLEPHTSAPLYDKPEVTAATEVVRNNPAFEAICVRIGDELFNIITFAQEAIAPQAFVFASK